MKTQGIELRVDFSPVKTWAEFVAESPPFSIALDGYIAEGPRFDSDGPRANYNHHDGVPRLETRSTCAQVLMAIRKGLFRRFRDAGGPRAIVWVRDCDEDVCTTWAELNNHALVEGAVNPLFNRLVQMEDMLDATAGAYPYPPDLPALRQLAWVYQPYRQFRLEGGLERRDPAAFRSIIEDVEHRILRYVTGSGDEIPIDTGFEVIGGGPGWSMVRETGAQARIGMLANGIQVYMSVRDRRDGRRTVTIGKLDPYHRADLERLARRLNELEGCTADCWGGGDGVMGSPQGSGTSLPPEILTEEMNAACGGAAPVSRSPSC